MEENNSYIGESKDMLLEMSEDERKHLEKEAREIASHKVKAALLKARKKGMQISDERGFEREFVRGFVCGYVRGYKIGEERTVRIISLHLAGMPNEEIAVTCDLQIDVVERVVDRFEQSRKA